jgi:hypothetical protein
VGAAEGLGEQPCYPRRTWFVSSHVGVHAGAGPGNISSCRLQNLTKADQVTPARSWCRMSQCFRVQWPCCPRGRAHPKWKAVDSTRTCNSPADPIHDPDRKAARSGGKKNAHEVHRCGVGSRCRLSIYGSHAIDSHLTCRLLTYL